MNEPDKTWKRIFSEGALAPLGMPVEHFKIFYKNNFSPNKNPIDQPSNTFITSLNAVSGVAGGFYAGSLATASLGLLPGVALGLIAIIPSYAAATAACLGIVAAGACVTGVVHGTFKVLRNILEHEDLLYGPKSLPKTPKPPHPATVNDPQGKTPPAIAPDFKTAAIAPKAEDANIEKLDKIIGQHKRRPAQNS